MKNGIYVTCYRHLFLMLLIMSMHFLVFMLCTNAASVANEHVHSLNRSTFPQGFIFGTASSAYQFEGAANEGGRGACIWDTYTHKFSDKISDHSNGDVAVDSYHRYKEDVRIMKNMNLDAYRFSISWSRILPNGKTTGGVNKEGITYYNDLINELLAHGIQPFVTLFHSDLPQTLEDEYGGFFSSRIVDDFRNYAEFCFQEFGDRVKHWITLNEPLSYCMDGYAVGVCSRRQNLQCTRGDFGTEPYLVGHYQLLAHAAAAKLYKEKYQAKQKGIVGIAVNSNWFVPLSESIEDKNATQRSLDFTFGWFVDPLAIGNYPQSMRSLVKERLPNFSKEQSEILKGSFDFIGLNYYTSRYVAHATLSDTGKPSYYEDSHTRQSSERNGISIGPKGASDWLYSYPRGVHDLLLYIKKKYNNPLVYITENGTSEANNATSLIEALADHMRIDYYYRHLSFLHGAIKHGANVQGYFAWSLLDNFEWSSGYSIRFGINYVDYKNGLKRHPKLSARWFSTFLRR